jgi:hypothetical protein
VKIPEPIPGLVIRYSYLWQSEFVSGRDEGSKDRPAAIVAAIVSDTDGKKRVLVLPITHTPPLAKAQETTIEIPPAVKRRLGLDDEPSWIVITEANEFIWPGPDLRPVPGDQLGGNAYGFLPPGLFARVQAAFVKAVEDRKMKRVPRTD